MNARTSEIAIVGGGLAGGLTALALARHKPEVSFVLLEAGETLGGNHRWSWFASDLSPAASDLLGDIRTTQWSDGYEVRFPQRKRTLTTPYHSMASTDFASALERCLPQGSIRTGVRASAVDAEGVTLEDGERIAARVVVDCRSAMPSSHLTGGWQVFMGRHFRTPRPHGLERPIIMDACVEQYGAFRFVYVLPLGAYELFVEDTYYADSPALDRSALSGRIDAYCAANGWQDAEIVGHETGALPVVTGGDFAAFRDATRIEGVVQAGARGGFTHPLTSYTLPFAAENALAIAAEADLPGAQLAAMMEARARAHWRSTAFYRMLGTMLYGVPDPDNRYRVFERFYGLSEPLIERFYAANSTLADRARVLIGKPPMPVFAAIGALLHGSGAPMAKEQRA